MSDPELLPLVIFPLKFKLVPLVAVIVPDPVPDALPITIPRLLLSVTVPLTKVGFVNV